MTATFSCKNVPGNFTKKVTATTNDPKHRRETLVCKGRVLVPFKSSPHQANFRRIEDYTTPQGQTITIRRGDGGPLKLELVGTGKPGIQVELREVKAGEHYQLVVGLDPPQRPGRLRSWVKLKTGIKKVPETTIPVYADIPRGWAKSKLLSAAR